MTNDSQAIMVRAETILDDNTSRSLSHGPEPQVCMDLRGIARLVEIGPSGLGAKKFVSRLMLAALSFQKQRTQIEGMRGILYWMRINRGVLLEAGRHLRSLLTILQMNEHGGCGGRFSYLILDIVKTLCASVHGRYQLCSTSAEIRVSLIRRVKPCGRDRYEDQIKLSIISWLVEDTDMCKMINNEGFIHYILHAMKIHSDDEVVQCNGSAALCWLVRAASDGDISTQLKNRDLDVVVDVMGRFMKNPMVLGNCLCILSGAAIENDANLSQVMSFVFLAMQYHASSAKVKVILNAVTLLRSLTCNNTLLESMAKRAVLDHLHVIEDILTQFSDHAMIQLETFTVLAAIASSEEGKNFIGQSRCIELALECQKKCRGNVRLQRTLLWFHSCFIGGAPSPVELAFGGGLHVLGLIAPPIVQQIHAGPNERNAPYVFEA